MYKVAIMSKPCSLSDQCTIPSALQGIPHVLPKHGAVEVKFPKAQAHRNIQLFSVGVVDGFLKVLMMVGIVCIIYGLETWLQHIEASKIHPSKTSKGILKQNSPTLFDPATSEDLTEEELISCDLDKVLASFAWIRCSFTHFKSPTHYHLHALRFLARNGWN